jgi:hypothetical protein
MRHFKNASCVSGNNNNRIHFPVGVDLCVPVVLILSLLTSTASGQWTTKENYVYVLGKNVGIGTGVPSSRLVVQGDGFAGTIRVWPEKDNAESGIGLYAVANDHGSPWMIAQGSWGNTGKLVFGYSEPRMVIQRDGKVGIGTVNPNGALDVAGNVFIYGSGKNPVNVKPDFLNKYALFVEQGVMSEDFAVAPVADWADFVFDKSYRLQNLDELKKYIALNNHLPNIPSQKDVHENGYSMHEMTKLMLEKIEDLTLYTIAQHEEIESLNEKYEALAKQVEELKQMIKANK